MMEMELERPKRRSTRIPAKKIEEQKNELWMEYLRTERQNGLAIKIDPIKGRGIFSTRTFQKVRILYIIFSEFPLKSIYPVLEMKYLRANLW